MHLVSTEAYVVVAGTGMLYTVDSSGYRETALATGSVVWFTPGTIHRAVNGGGLRVVVIMSNAGLPEAGDAVLTFPSGILKDPAAYRAAAVLPSRNTQTEREADAFLRRDLAVEGFAAIRDAAKAGDLAPLHDFYAAATALVQDRAAGWVPIVEDGPVERAAEPGDGRRGPGGERRTPRPFRGAPSAWLRRRTPIRDVRPTDHLRRDEGRSGMSNRTGVIAASARMGSAFDAGAEYFEPYVVGGVAVQDGEAWVANPELDGRRFPSFAVAFPGTLSLVDPAGGLATLEAYLDQVLPLIAARAEPGAKVVLGSGRSRNIPEHLDRQSAEAHFAEAVRTIQARGREHGLEYLLEPLNSGETNLLTSIADAVEFIDRYDLNIRLVADLHHVVADHQPLQDTGVHLARVGHVHLAGPGRGPLDANGTVWREYVQILRAGGYDGAMSLECEWTDAFDAEVASSLELLRAELGASA